MLKGKVRNLCGKLEVLIYYFVIYIFIYFKFTMSITKYSHLNLIKMPSEPNFKIIHHPKHNLKNSLLL